MSVAAIPVCARDGDNVTAPSGRMPWYSGPTVLGALEAAQPRRADAGRPFRMPVQYVNRPDHSFRGYAGTVAAGTVRPGDPVVNASSGVRTAVARIATMDGDLPEAAPGTPVTLVLDREIDVSRGDVLSADPAPTLADRIEAWVVWMDETPLYPGRSYQIMLGAKTALATVSDISARLDVGTLAKEPVRQSERARGRAWGWRRGRDSNPRYPCGYTGFRDQHNRPLCHLSEAKMSQ